MCRYTEIAQRICKYNDIQYTSPTVDKKTEQFDMSNAILSTYTGVTKVTNFQKTVRFLTQPV